MRRSSASSYIGVCGNPPPPQSSLYLRVHRCQAVTRHRVDNWEFDLLLISFKVKKKLVYIVDNIADAGITVGAVIWIASLFLERETEST